MIDSFFQHVTGLFTRRFVFNALLPTLVFCTAAGAVVVASVSSFAAVSSWWKALDLASKVLAVLAYLAAVWFVAAAVASQWRGIVRLFEGYPLVRVMGRRTPGIRWHTDRMETMAERDANVYYRYPTGEDEDRLMPTRLGNVLLAAESYPRARYQIDPIIFWPRLFPMLPEQFQREYEEYIIAYEFPLVVSFQATAATVVSAGTLLVTRQGPELFLGVLALGCVVAYAFYRLSLSAAEEYGEQLRTAFDLYRGRLLEAWPTVADVADEKEAFAAIHRFVVMAAEPGWADSQERHAVRNSPRSDVGADPQ
ncbi:hypothetical protein ACIBG8_47280 [Nonomuraea sp. NPDC050556]|uniref:hypothetical protein n=1 Tax=Nonomuraea sp. NPDC050556 TaxID=3364369 RepID=UPI0037955DE2